METLKAVTKAHTKFLTSLMLIVGLIFTACDVSDSEGTGTLRVHLTDSPADYAEVNVQIQQVLVKRIDNETEDDTTSTEGMDDDDIEDNGWEVVFNGDMTVNLLDYQNGKTLELGEVELETGHYQEIRLVLGENNSLVMDGGESFNLHTPSAQTSGYKLKVDATIEDGEQYDLVIDFDASQSIVVRGNGMFNLKPVLRTVDLYNTATISGVITPVEADAYVYTVADEDTIGTTPDEEGAFTLFGLHEGTYDIWVEASNEMYADSSFTDISIEEGEDFAIEDTLILRMQ